jgi:hypothetical protein
MAANAIPTPELKVNTAKGDDESCASVTLEQRFERLLREVFEGHEKYLGRRRISKFVSITIHLENCLGICHTGKNFIGSA